MKVSTIKMINGEEIVGEMNVVNDTIQIKNAVVLRQMQDPASGKVVNAFGDWPALAAPDQVVVVPVTAVCTLPLGVHEELERQYIGSITGLELPPATPKILLS